MPTLEERVDRLEAQLQATMDRQSIVELTGRYCRAVASDDMEALLGLFTEDASLITGFPPESGQDHAETRGRDALRETYKGTAGMGLKPCVHNHVVELDGDRARGFCSLELRLSQDGVPYTAAGHYEDKFRRDAGEWLFESRKITLYHWVPQSEGWA
jgi:ketosteroid isomerase-like protein